MRLIIVSGRSGSGKSTALDVLEDNDFYCIDNLPAMLLPELAERTLLAAELVHPQIAVSIDARNAPNQLERFPELLAGLRERHIVCDVLYLDADDETLLKRFSETRRRHPLTDENRSLAEAIRDLRDVGFKGHTLVRLRMAFCTWAPATDLALLARRASRLALTRSRTLWAHVPSVA